MSVLTVSGLSKQYGATLALDDISFSVAPGIRAAIVGPSGSGKTTLLRIIAGFETAAAGTVTIGNEIIVDGGLGVPAHLRGIGVVTQDGSLFPHLSIAENIGFGLTRNQTDRDARIAELMDIVELPRSMAERRPHQLSGGQQQRVAIARALARRPRLMLLDEPFSALDTGLRETMRRKVADVLREFAVTAILVTHDQGEALGFADQLVVLKEGRLVQAGPPRLLYMQPRNPAIARFLGDAILLQAELADGAARCALGQIAITDRTRRGPATILLRPEQLRLRPSAASELAGGTGGRIVEVEFGGASSLVTIALDADTDTLLQLRSSDLSPPEPGTHVAIEVSGAAYPFDGATALEPAGKAKR